MFYMLNMNSIFFMVAVVFLVATCVQARYRLQNNDYRYNGYQNEIDDSIDNNAWIERGLHRQPEIYHEREMPRFQNLKNSYDYPPNFEEPRRQLNNQYNADHLYETQRELIKRNNYIKTEDPQKYDFQKKTMNYPERNLFHLQKDYDSKTGISSTNGRDDGHSIDDSLMDSDNSKKEASDKTFLIKKGLLEQEFTIGNEALSNELKKKTTAELQKLDNYQKYLQNQDGSDKNTVLPEKDLASNKLAEKGLETSKVLDNKVSEKDTATNKLNELDLLNGKLNSKLQNSSDIKRELITKELAADKIPEHGNQESSSTVKSIDQLKDSVIQDVINVVMHGSDASIKPVITDDLINKVHDYVRILSKEDTKEKIKIAPTNDLFNDSEEKKNVVKSEEKNNDLLKNKKVIQEEDGARNQENSFNNEKHESKETGNKFENLFYDSPRNFYPESESDAKVIRTERENNEEQNQEREFKAFKNRKNILNDLYMRGNVQDEMRGGENDFVHQRYMGAPRYQQSNDFGRYRFQNVAEKNNYIE